MQGLSHHRRRRRPHRGSEPLGGDRPRGGVGRRIRPLHARHDVVRRGLVAGAPRPLPAAPGGRGRRDGHVLSGGAGRRRARGPHRLAQCELAGSRRLLLGPRGRGRPRRADMERATSRRMVRDRTVHPSWESSSPPKEPRRPTPTAPHAIPSGSSPSRASPAPTGRSCWSRWSRRTGWTRSKSRIAAESSRTWRPTTAPIGRTSLGPDVRRGCASDRCGMRGAPSRREPAGRSPPVAASPLHAESHVRKPRSAGHAVCARRRS